MLSPLQEPGQEPDGRIAGAQSAATGKALRLFLTP